jgi:hypothetical protein
MAYSKTVKGSESFDFLCLNLGVGHMIYISGAVIFYSLRRYQLPLVLSSWVIQNYWIKCIIAGKGLERQILHFHELLVCMRISYRKQTTILVKEYIEYKSGLLVL